MALAPGNLVVPAGVVNGTGRVADLSCGSLCPDGVVLGVYRGEAAVTVSWNNGKQSPGTAAGIPMSPENLRRVTAGGGLPLIGREVQLIGKPVVFRGYVAQQFAMELDNTNNTGTQTNVVVVRTPTFTYIALLDSVQVV